MADPKPKVTTADHEAASALWEASFGDCDPFPGDLDALALFRAEARAEENNRIEGIVVAMIDEHDRVEEGGYQRPCAAPGKFCECFGVSNLREIGAAIRRRGDE